MVVFHDAVIAVDALEIAAIVVPGAVVDGDTFPVPEG